MLDIAPIIDLAKLLVGANPLMKYYGKAVYIPMYTAAASFVCYTEGVGIRLLPVALRLIFEKAVTDTTSGRIVSASITCSTRHHVGKMVGAQVCIESPTFELYGRLRRSKCNNFLRPMCGSSFVTLAISSVLSPNSCNYCEFKGIAKPQGGACNSCSVSHFKVKTRKNTVP